MEDGMELLVTRWRGLGHRKVVFALVEWVVNRVRVTYIGTLLTSTCGFGCPTFFPRAHAHH